MDTVVTVTVASDSDKKAEAAIEAAFDEIRGLEKKLSFWTEDSEIASINRESGMRPVKVSRETLEIIKDSVYVSEKTGGAFDPTVGPVIRQWDFKKKKRPTDEALKEAASRVDYRALVIDGDTVFLSRAGMSFDTGGIAKGFAADRAEAVLKRMGIKAGLISVAGDIKAFGLKPDGRPWRVGIRNPRAVGEEDDVMATVELKDMAVSTSGDYERFFMEGRRRYHHLLDPRTGYPAQGFMSVSIVAPRSVMADGFSTGVFVAGPEEGLALLKDLGMEGVFVDSEGDVHVTDGLKGAVEVTHRPAGARQ
jgi:thiamine biosynthesis lipoprotein